MIYALLYFAAESQITNLSSKDQRTASRIYVRNALLFCRSLVKSQLRLALITNNAALLKTMLRDDQEAEVVEIIEIAFTYVAPEGIPFLAAHYKLDIYKYLASKVNQYSLVVDLDVVCLSPDPVKLFKIVKANKVLMYEITDQVTPAYGANRIALDKRKLGAVCLDPTWFGGEFVGGDSDFFRRLSDKVDLIWPTYCKSWQMLHHQGDEIITTVAFGQLCGEGLDFIDAGKEKVVARHWSGHTLHAQASLADTLSGLEFLHLPQDKAWLAEFYSRSGNKAFDELALKHQYTFHYWVLGIRRGCARLRKRLRRLKI